MTASYRGWTGAVMAANHQRLDWCCDGCKQSAAGLVWLGLQPSAELLRMYNFNQKIIGYKGIANN
jgi:hypothetical protein